MKVTNLGSIQSRGTQETRRCNKSFAKFGEGLQLNIYKELYKSIPLFIMQ